MAALSNDKCRSIVLLVARPELQVRNYRTLNSLSYIFQPLIKKILCGPNFGEGSTQV